MLSMGGVERSETVEDTYAWPQGRSPGSKDFSQDIVGVGVLA